MSEESLMSRKVVYYGFLGKRNVGDEAIFQANRKLFPEWDFILPSSGAPSDITFLGGGTILPVALKPWSFYAVEKRRWNFCMGCGVLDPQFHRRRLQVFDVPWAAGQLGINLIELLHRIRRILRDLGWWGRAVDWIYRTLERPLGLNRLYPTDEDYRLIGEFGFDFLGVRGPLSQEILARYGIKSEIIGDPALYLEPTEYVERPTKRIAISILNSASKYFKQPKWTDKTAYLYEIYRFCKAHAGTYEFVILPFNPSDVPLSRELARWYPNASVRDYTTSLDVQGIIDEIAHCDLVIGERLHANVLSACCHVPFISLEYAPQCRDFVLSLGLEEMNIRIDEVTSEQLEERFVRAMTDDSIRGRLGDEVNAIRLKLKAVANEIQARVIR
jgi:hypothetical protein